MRRSKRSASLTVAAVFALACLASETAHTKRVAVGGAGHSSALARTWSEADPLLVSPTHLSNAFVRQGGGSPHYTLAPDSQFGTGGRVTTDFGSRYDDARAAALQPDGKVILAGKADANDGLLCSGRGGGRGSSTCNRCYTGTNGIPNANFALARYQTSGTLDAAFGVGGRVLTDFGGEDEVHAVR
jgi:hypothetical protein